MNSLFQFHIDYLIGKEIHLKSQGKINFTDNHFIKSIFGVSGCGKTSLLKIFLGFAPQKSGEIQFKDQIWQDAKHFVPTFQRNIGFVPQKECLFPFLNVQENIIYAIQNWEPQKIKKRLDELLELFQLKDLANRKISEVSGGQRQRISLARAVASFPQLLLLDEAFSALDSKSREQLLPELSKWLHELKIPAIVISHDERDARLLSSEIYHFEGHSLLI